jgi:type II secretory pathway pseudopilin PulG
MALLVVIAASSIALTTALPDLYQTAKREREAQLLFVGRQYSEAIRRFYENPLVVIKRYPNSLDELVTDNRSLRPRHHLRKLYPDPMTGRLDWGLIKNEQDQIMGVYSQSGGKPLRTDFARHSVTEVAGGGQQYADFKFVYLP